MKYRDHTKRVVDVILSSILLLLSAPVIAAALLLVRTSSAGPVFFTQPRVGKHERVFRIYKIRTMAVDPNRLVSQTRDRDADVLPIGRFLRRFKIDELPQLLNVLKGDMSVIGPRPCLQSTVETMPSQAKRRFELRPGLTGLAQINGNVELSWKDRWVHDVSYVDECSLLLDVQILLKTILVVVAGEGRFRSVK